MTKVIYKSWKEIQDERRDKIKKVCGLLSSKIDENFGIEYNNLFTDDEHRVLFCSVPKIASTNIKRTLLALGGHTNTSNPMLIDPNSVNDEVFLKKYGLRRLDTFSQQDIQYRLENYVKFMFVRHPFERLLSAYKSKFQKETKFQEFFGKMIVRKYRQNPSVESLRRGHDVRFEEFLKFIAEQVVLQRSILPETWRQYYKTCFPCHINYNYIGKLETIYNDAAHIFKETHYTSDVLFPIASKSYFHTINTMRDHFKNVSSADVERLMEIYALDFALFGYDVAFAEPAPSFTGPAPHLQERMQVQMQHEMLQHAENPPPMQPMMEGGPDSVPQLPPGMVMQEPQPLVPNMGPAQMQGMGPAGRILAPNQNQPGQGPPPGFGSRLIPRMWSDLVNTNELCSINYERKKKLCTYFK